MKYAVKLTSGNNVKILNLFDTKEEALEFGESTRKDIKASDGLLSVIRAEFDSDNSIIGGRYRLVHSWL